MPDVRTVTDESLDLARRLLAEGELIVVPTDTVYGIACDPRNDEAMERIYAAKGRPKYKALQVLVSSADDLDGLGLDLPAPLNRLAAAFLPGAFSPICIARDDCTLGTVRPDGAGHMTQGIRVPNSAVSRQILKAVGPLACSSANRSGEQSAQSAQEAVEAFGDDVALYLDAGSTPGHIASTVVAADPLERDGIAILREGMIPESAIRRAIHLNGGGLGA